MSLVGEGTGVPCVTTGATVSIFTDEASVVAVICTAGFVAISEKSIVIATGHCVSNAVTRYVAE